MTAPAITLPTVIPATGAALGETTATRAAASAAGAQPSAAKPATAKSAAAPADTDADTDADLAAQAAALAGALCVPGISVPTLQPAAASLAPAASAGISTVTSDSADSDPAPEPADVPETAAPSMPAVAKSPAAPEAFVLSADAPSIGQSDSTAAAPDRSATAMAAAQSGSLHAPAAHAQSATDARPPPEIRAPLGSSAWTEELGAQLTWMSRHGQESASLHLSPEHLGPVEVRIDVRDGAARVWFGAAHADTRSALEQSLPRLRELFAASGLSLTDAGVARDAPRQNAKPVAPLALASSAGNAAISTSKVSLAPAHSGLIDTYV